MCSSASGSFRRERAAPMIKLLTFLKRREPMTPAELKTRWLTIHAPIALEFPGLRGYMLSFPVVTEPEPAADAVAQLWFDSREACQESYATDIGRNGSADANAYLSRRQHMLASEDWLACERSLEPTELELLARHIDDCLMCRNFSAQLKFLGKAARAYREGE